MKQSIAFNTATSSSSYETIALTTRCYRTFLANFLSTTGLSYRDFAQKYSAHISFSSLSKILRRDSKGEFVREYNPRPEMLAALFRSMGLSSNAVSHLMICRLENDQKPGSYRNASAFSSFLKSLYKENSETTSFARVIAALEALSHTRRGKVLEELKHQLSIEIDRSSSNLRSMQLKQLINEIQA